MGLINKTVKIKWNSRIKKHYEELGYTYTKMGEEFEVKVEDLTKGSHVKIECICDNCGQLILSWKYQDYIKYVKENGETYCNKCAMKLYGTENYKKTRLKNGKSFKQWCIENNRQDVLDRWDYELNSCLPSEVSYRTNKKYWFKCDKRKWHKSELKSIKDFTTGHEGVMDCKQCNSIAQYILDSFPDKDLYDVWDKERNGDKDPWMIPFGSRQKCWFICQEKDYHGSYNNICAIFSKGIRCSYCGNLKTHPLDSLKQSIINEYGEEFFNIVWSDKNTIDPINLKPNSFIECWWNCPKGKHEPFKRSCSESKEAKYRCPNCYEPLKGEDSPRWNPNLTQEERELSRHIEGYNEWRKQVYERDNYTCQCCKNKQKNNLNAHHLNGYNWDKEHRLDIGNGITLCKECHREFHKLYGQGNNTKEQFEEYLKNKNIDK